MYLYFCFLCSRLVSIFLTYYAYIFQTRITSNEYEIKLSSLLQKLQKETQHNKSKRLEQLIYYYGHDSMFRIVTLIGDLRYTRHLAADCGSTLSFSVVEDSLSSIFFDETSLDPLKLPLWFWIEVLGEKTPRGVCTTSTESGLGILRMN